MEASDFFYNFLERAYLEYTSDSSDEYKFRVACLFSFHMTDYVFENSWKNLGFSDKSKKNRTEFIKYISNENNYLGNNFGVVQAVCNSTKHLSSNYHDLQETIYPVNTGSTSNTPVTIPIPNEVLKSQSKKRVISIPHWELEIDGERLDASWALDQTYYYWRRYINDQN